MSRRIEIRLPDGHPVFKYPSGTRNAMVIELINTGLALSQIEDKIGSLEVETNEIGESLKRIEAMLQNGGPIQKDHQWHAKNELSREDKNKITRNILAVFG